MLKQDMPRSSHKSVQTTSTNRLRQFFVTKVIVGHGKAVLEVPGKDDSVVPTLQLRKPPEGLEGAASLSTQEAPSVKKHSWHFSNMSDLCFLSFALISSACSQPLLLFVSCQFQKFHTVGAQALGFWSCAQTRPFQFQHWCDISIQSSSSIICSKGLEEGLVHLRSQKSGVRVTFHQTINDLLSLVETLCRRTPHVPLDFLPCLIVNVYLRCK